MFGMADDDRGDREVAVLVSVKSSFSSFQNVEKYFEKIVSLCSSSSPCTPRNRARSSNDRDDSIIGIEDKLTAGISSNECAPKIVPGTSGRLSMDLDTVLKSVDGTKSSRSLRW
jgi:hypothetical protein